MEHNSGVQRRGYIQRHQRTPINITKYIGLQQATVDKYKILSIASTLSCKFKWSQENKALIKNSVHTGTPKCCDNHKGSLM